MTSTNIDYTKTYFQYPTLSVIHGEPTYEGLQELKDELKANAATVSSNLGGGSHGHLGLIMTLAEYTNLAPETPYITPVHPGPLIIAEGTTQHNSTRLTREHNEQIRVFRESVDVKQALIKQIVASIETKYLKTLRNSVTNTITRSVPEILTYLFHRYGRVNPDTLCQKETELRAFVYTLQDPLVTLYDQVEDLKKLGDAAQMPYTEHQIVNFGIQLIRNTHDFQDGLKQWFSKEIRDKTWENFKIHFEDEYDKLKQVRGATMRHAGFHQANQMSNKVMEEVQGIQHNVLQLLQKFDEDDKENEKPEEQPTNLCQEITSSDNIQLEMMKIIKSLQDEMKVLKNKDNRNHRNRDFYERNKNNNPDREFGRSQRTDQYCWSHGACAHSGKKCFSKRNGHKDEANFKDKMGGSTYRCK